MSITKHAYDRVLRKYLPRKLGRLNGVTARHPRLFDRTDVFPSYEAELVDALETHVCPSDHVLVIGGGLGVTATIAARHGDHVTAYEASHQRYQLLRETLELNGVTESVEPHHALVGPAINVNGVPADRTVSPDSLPECDVLEIDAEGAETEILRHLDIRPRVIIVEAHRQQGAPADAIAEQLSGLGYEIVDSQTQNRRKGIVILTAVRYD